MEEIQLTLTIDETNLILEGLGNMPFVKVHQLITKIQQQAEPQLQSSVRHLDMDHTSNSDNQDQ